MAVTLKDIAIRAGVTVAAVSYTLSDSGRVNPKTREKILKIAADLGYRRNLLVSGIRLGRSWNVAVIYTEAEEFGARLLKGVHDRLVINDYAPVVLYPRPGKSELEQILAAVDRRVDGIILRINLSDAWEPHLEEITSRKIPLVIMDFRQSGWVNHFDLAATNDFEGGKQAAYHLAGLGHRHIGLLDFHVHPKDYTHPDRCRGFLSTIEQISGAHVTKMTIKNNDIHDPLRSVDENDRQMKMAAMEMTMKLLRENPKITAIFTSNDLLVPGIYEAAKSQDLDIPRDLSVVGFADLAISKVMNPPLTTVQQYPEKIGAAAADLVLEAINDKARKKTYKPKQILIGTDLAIRFSTAAPSLKRKNS